MNKIWGHGFVVIAPVCFESAKYVARYVTKKINGKKKEEIDEKTGAKHYEVINYVTGEIHERQQEYVTMSRKPGIGKRWFDQYYATDIYNKDYCNVNGRKQKPARYYDKLFEEIDPWKMEAIKLSRLEYMREHAEDNTPERLAQKEKCKIKSIENLTREKHYD